MDQEVGIEVNPLNNWMLHLMAQMFSFEDKIAVCLHPKDTISGDYMLQRASESATKLEPIKVDLNFTNSSLDVDENLRTITASDRAKYVWRTALGTRCMKTGIHKWEVVIEKTTSTCNIMIGQHRFFPAGMK